MAAVSKLRERWAVEGARRVIKYKVTITASGQTLQTPLHVLDYVDAISTTTQPVGITASKGLLTFSVTTTPDTLLVDVVGL